MRIIIAGSRDFNDYRLLYDKCSEIFIEWMNNEEDFEIISGGARGADYLGEKFALANHYKLTIMDADWEKYGRSAGYIRNEQMAEYASRNNGMCICFWINKSKGTKHMIDIAKRYNLRTYIIEA